MGRGEGGERAGLLHCNQIQEKGREGQSSTYSVPTMCYALRDREPVPVQDTHMQTVRSDEERGQRLFKSTKKTKVI